MKPLQLNTQINTQTFFPVNPSPQSSPQAGDATEASFGEMLKEHLKEVNHLQNAADTAAQNLASGKDEDVHNTMIAMEKASVAFQLTMQVRNKVIDAYQEIMRMQV